MVSHSIDTEEARPIRQRLRCFPPAHVEAISQQVDDLLRQEVIKPASSPRASNLVLVRKKDGSYRCCIDYLQLNSVTRKDAYPLPRIDSCLDALANARWFPTFDLRSSYHQVPDAKCDADKTAFMCPRGMYRFKAMPFGLYNAGATFQRLMDIVMSGLHFHVCLIYLDDIIVFAGSLEQYLYRLVMVFQRLRTAGLKLKPEKCLLLQKSVSFLGHVVSVQGIATTDPSKIKLVAEWPTPRSLRDVRAFLGLAGYYQRLVAGFASIAGPLHAMMGKGEEFLLTPEAQQSFNRLKVALTSQLILAMLQDEGEMILDTDASDTAIGAVLSQKQGGYERVIAYVSRRLDRTEANYCVTRKELLAVVHFMRHFRQYLLSRAFLVRTDHSALTWLRRTPEPIGQQARWLEVMEEFHFRIEHCPGARHGNANALSRHPCRLHHCACHGSDQSTEGRESAPIPEYKGGDESTEAGQLQEVNAVRRARGVGPSVGEEADRPSSNVSAPGAPDPEVPLSLEGLQAAQKTDKDTAIII